ncbi:Bacillopeptidase F [bioreactor metagenome]|uniref:Bacillopeptidase F n=1 Tax=bioreactor metagenome TaxID=1076179 RepID=A0A645F1K2_9ZZZZ
MKFSVFLGNTKKVDNSDEKLVPPLAPRLVIPYEATNSANISVNGFTEVGVEVELFKNEVSIGKTQVTDSGDFAFKNISLEEGSNSFSAIAISKKAGSSDGSTPILVSFDNKIPELKIINPTESELTVDYADFDIIGESEKGASVTINGKVAVVDDDGKFKLKFQLNMGKNELEIVSKDMAGNESKKKITITYSF